MSHDPKHGHEHDHGHDHAHDHSHGHCHDHSHGHHHITIMIIISHDHDHFHDWHSDATSTIGSITTAARMAGAEADHRGADRGGAVFATTRRSTCWTWAAGAAC